jgi:hypothetical protein
VPACTPHAGWPCWPPGDLGGCVIYARLNNSALRRLGGNAWIGHPQHRPGQRRPHTATVIFVVWGACNSGGTSRAPAWLECRCSTLITSRVDAHMCRAGTAGCRAVRDRKATAAPSMPQDACLGGSTSVLDAPNLHTRRAAACMVEAAASRMQASNTTRQDCPPWMPAPFKHAASHGALNENLEAETSAAS